MNGTSVVLTELEVTYEDEMILDNMITIQPSHISLQVQSNNYSIGLVLVIIAITLLTAFLGADKFWIKEENNNLKP